MIELPGRSEAKNYGRQQSIYLFHRKLWDFYHIVKKHCDDVPDAKCNETPKLVCLRSLRQYPPVQCKLCEVGYFPLTVDQRFAEDVARDSISPIEVTGKNAKRFEHMLANVKSFRLVKKKPTEDLLQQTMVSI